MIDAAVKKEPAEKHSTDQEWGFHEFFSSEWPCKVKVTGQNVQGFKGSIIEAAFETLKRETFAAEKLRGAITRRKFR
jgi:hypothetical protein